MNHAEIEVKNPKDTVVEAASFVHQTGPVGHPITLTAPAITASGQTGQLFIAATANWRIVDVALETPNARVVSLMAGTSDVSLPEGGSWSEVLSVQDVRVTKGQYVTVLVRNDSPAPARLRATVSVVEDKSAPVTTVSGAKHRAVRTAATVAPKGPAEITEHGEPVRFLVGRGLIPYVVRFLQGGQIPKQMHSAVLASFEGSRMVVPAGRAHSATQEAEIVLGEHVRAEIGRAVRFRMAPNLSMGDRAVVAEHLMDALQDRRPQDKLLNAKEAPIVAHTTEGIPVRSWPSAANSDEVRVLELRVESLEKQHADAVEELCETRTLLRTAESRVAELEKMADDAAPDSKNEVDS